MDVNNETTLIETYRKSDFGDRIFLSLEHRSLRSDFSAIDMADAKRIRNLAAEKDRLGASKHRWWYPMKMVFREFFSKCRPASDYTK